MSDVQGGSSLFAEQKQELDEEWHEAFDALTAQGKSPSGIKAAIEYVTTEKTQSEISREYSTSEVTVRSLYPTVIALGPLEPDEAEVGSSDYMTVVDYSRHVADVLGWTEGDEYSVSENSYGQTSVSIKKSGWESLYEVLTNGE